MFYILYLYIYKLYNNKNVIKNMQFYLIVKKLFIVIHSVTPAIIGNYNSFTFCI